jgi:hypothetical protein
MGGSMGALMKAAEDAATCWGCDASESSIPPVVASMVASIVLSPLSPAVVLAGRQ